MDDSKLSVCLIVKNEEKFLEDCLLSVKECAAEIIVVDTGSEDLTTEIAIKHGCRVVYSPWENDFSKARNVGISLAKYPFILSIDADERLVNPHLINKILSSANEKTGGWLIKVVSEAAREDGSNDIFSTNLIRLFRNYPGIKFEGAIHEQIVESILQNGFNIENTDLVIKHLGYSHNPDEMRKKQIRNLELLNAVLEKEPENTYYLFQRAKTHLALNNLQLAETDIIKTLELVKYDSAVKPQALNYGGIISYRLGNINEAIVRAEKSLEIIPRQCFANFILAEASYTQKRYELAINYYHKIEENSKVEDIKTLIIGDYHLPYPELYFKLGRCYIALGNLDKAEGYFHKGLQEKPDDINCTVGIANVKFKLGEYDKSIQLLEKANLSAPNREDIDGFIEQVKKAAKFQNHIPQTNGLISLSMIVKNEENMLPGCLESVKDIVDEMIIVDTGSTDRTKEIALSYGAKVYDFEWNNSFADARNESLKHCKSEWILYMDADERLSHESRLAIRRLLTDNPGKADGYICTIESEHVQLDGSVENHRGGYPRIFRNLGYPAIKFEGRVHEQITPSIFALGKTIAFSDIKIIHLGYNHTREVMEAKIKRNYALLMQHINEEPLNGYAWYQLGQTLAQMNLFTQAEQSIRFAIEVGKLSDSVYASAASMLSQMTGNQKKYTEALYWAEKSLEKAPDQIYALHLKAYSLLYLGKKKESEQYFLEVLKRLRAKKGVPQSGFDIEIPENVVLQGLGEARK